MHAYALSLSRMKRDLASWTAANDTTAQHRMKQPSHDNPCATLAVSATKLRRDLDHVEHAALEGNAHGLARWLQEGQRWVEHWDAKAHHPQHQGTV